MKSVVAMVRNQIQLASGSGSMRNFFMFEEQGILFGRLESSSVTSSFIEFQEKINHINLVCKKKNIRIHKTDRSMNLKRMFSKTLKDKDLGQNKFDFSAIPDVQVFFYLKFTYLSCTMRRLRGDMQFTDQSVLPPSLQMATLNRPKFARIT